MITRIWHARTTPEKAEAYRAFLTDEIFPMIRAKRIEGLLELDLLTRVVDGEHEFVTVFWFTSIEAVRSFAGENYHLAVVADTDRALLSSFSETVDHYEVRAREVLASR